MSATDADVEPYNKEVTFMKEESTNSAYFSVAKTTGEVTINNRLPQNINSLLLNVQAWNYGSPNLFSSQTLRIYLTGLSGKHKSLN